MFAGGKPKKVDKIKLSTNIKVIEADIRAKQRNDKQNADIAAKNFLASIQRRNAADFKSSGKKYYDFSRKLSMYEEIFRSLSLIREKIEIFASGKPPSETDLICFRIICCSSDIITADSLSKFKVTIKELYGSAGVTELSDQSKLPPQMKTWLSQEPLADADLSNILIDCCCKVANSPQPAIEILGIASQAAKADVVIPKVLPVFERENWPSLIEKIKSLAN